MALPRIAILGGGVGAITAAVQLSRPGWRSRFESITVYQQGWRLGGKGACGRGRDARIEEHGLHIWFGFYENAFRMLHRCHEELDALEAAPGGPARWDLAFTSMEQSFRATSEITLTDHDGCGWKLWVADFFEEDDDRPWAEPDPRGPGERPEDWSAAFYLSRCLHLAADLSMSLVRSDPGLELAAEPAAAGRAELRALDELAELLWASLGGDVRDVLHAAAEVVDAVLDRGARDPLALGLAAPLVRALDIALDFLRGRYDELARASDSVRRAYYVVDILVAIARGLIEDGVLEQESFAPIDDIDFRDWLLAHGARRDSADCALVRSVIYDLAFAYEGGDPQRPSCAAGTAVRGLLRTFFTYRGALMWKMNAGMGDVVFSPLYELLVKRGVDVRFFHRVEALRVANGLVEEIEIDVQATPPPNTTAKGYLAPGGVWPADPAPLLATGQAQTGAPSAGGPAPQRYESWYAGRQAAHVATKVLRRGQPDGFDVVVFGLPVSCIPCVAGDLMNASPVWSAAARHVRTVPTQAMQLWLDRPAEDLGHAPTGAVVGGFVEPYDTWADLAQLVGQEQVQGSKTVAYFCNAMLDAPPPARGQAQQWLQQQDDLVRARAVRFLRRDIRGLWPKAVDPLTGEFHWQRLVAPAGAQGQARLDWQYLRANVEPSERYVLSVPGSGVHRIAPADTGFANLYAAGDWTACLLDAGCVEAAVISGMLAANGIHEDHGHAAEVDEIVGAGGP